MGPGAPVVWHTAPMADTRRPDGTDGGPSLEMPSFSLRRRGRVADDEDAAASADRATATPDPAVLQPLPVPEHEPGPRRLPTVQVRSLPAASLTGVAVGGLFAGESMFHRARDASKVALVGLVEMLRDDADDRRLLDVQWLTPHLASLGVVAVPRRRYLRELLPAALQVPPPFARAT